MRHRWFIALAFTVLATTAAAHAAPRPDLLHLSEGKDGSLCSHARTLAEHIAAQQSETPSLREADANTDVTHCFLDIEIIPEYVNSNATAVKVEGTSTIDAQAAVDGLAEFTLDLRDNLTINSVTGDVSTWSRVGHTIEITLDQTYNTGEPFQVIVDYEGYPSSASFAAFKWWERNDNLVVATLSEPFYARYWWPCKDALNDKSTMQMHVTVPDSMVAVSNGLDDGTDVLSGGRIKYKWSETYPMIPYLASLAITNYERYDLQYTYDDGGTRASMPVPCYLYPDHWDYGAGQPQSTYKTGCDELPIILEVLAQPYGLYPFVAEKYGVAETGGTGGIVASMEHQTISSMSRVNNFSDIMCHELAHQWWGDLVTCETWYDIWLNEGFASYSEPLYRELKPGGGTASYWARVNDRRPTFPDRQVYRTSISSTGDIFSGNDVYNKGSWVLHMLRHVMGDDAFFGAIADYRAAFADDSVTTAEFTASFSTSFGHNLEWFVNQWVMSPGSPDYEWNYATGTVAGQHYLKLAIWQEQDGEGYGLVTMPIDIRVTTSTGASVHTVWNDDWTEYYVIPIDGAPTNVEFDEDGGTSDRNWVLFDTRTQVATPVEPPPVLLAADVVTFANAFGATTVDLTFSEDIAGLNTTDVSLTGETTGPQWPQAIVYSPATQTATVTYASLPHDAYTFTVLATDVTANAKPLDGEIDDSNWWDDTVLPSGDGQPGGDAILPFTKKLGDADGDGDIDLDDFAGLPDCLTGPDNTPYTDGCGVFDFDTDADIDLEDFDAFQQALAAG